MSEPPVNIEDTLKEVRLRLERGDAEGALKLVRVLERLMPGELELDFLKQYQKMELKLADAVRQKANAEALLRLHAGHEIPEAQLNKIVCGALKSTINDHGPITKNMLGSAAKRVIGEIKSYLKGNTFDGISGD
jgi:hypothetical protein